MTTKQMQCLLTYLGYDTDEVDGIRAKTDQILSSFLFLCTFGELVIFLRCDGRPIPTFYFTRN